MNISVRLASPLRRFVNGQERIAVNGSSPLECLRELGAKFPGVNEWLYDSQGAPQSHLLLLVNRKRIYEDEFMKGLNDGDELFIGLYIAGG